MQYESGFKPAKHHRGAAAGHKLGFVSLGSLQVGRTGKRCCFPSLAQACAAQASHYSCPGHGCSWSPFWRCWHGMGERSSVLHSSQPPSHQPGGKQSPVSLEQGCHQCLGGVVGGVVSVAPVLLSWLQAHPLCEPFMSRNISHFRAGCLVGVAGREVQGAVLFQL